MTYTVRFVDLQEQKVAVIRDKVSHEAMADFLGAAFHEVQSAAEEQGLHITGAPFGRYQPIDDGGWDITAGFPVSGDITPTGRVEADTLPGGTAAQTMHVGAYELLSAAYEAAMNHVIDEGYQMTGDPWECYLDGPDVAEPRTELFVPCERVHPHE
jgi:effector-binding domain-containing protein